MLISSLSVQVGSLGQDTGVALAVVEALLLGAALLGTVVGLVLGAGLWWCGRWTAPREAWRRPW